MTKILRCTCKHEWQDKRYGKQLRVFNELSKAKGVANYRCTVCTKEK